MTPVRIAVIGAGHLGQIHARLLRGMADVNLVAVVDPDAEVRGHLAREQHVATYATIEELPAQLDAAVVAAPSTQHTEIARALLARQVHLLVEKPLATSAADAQMLCQTAERQQRVLQVGHIERYNPAWARAHALVRDPVFIEAHRMAPYAVRSTDVGVVMDLMVHDLELALHAVDSEVVRVTAVGFCFFGQHEDIAQARLEFRNGALAHLTASRVSSTMARTWHLVTPQLSAQVDLAEHRLEIIRPRPDTPTEHARVCSLPPARRRWFRDHLFETLLTREAIDVPPVNALVQELEEFVAAVRGEQPVRVDGRAGAEAVVLAERVIESLRKKTSDAPLRPLQLQNGITATSPVAEPIRQRYAG